MRKLAKLLVGVVILATAFGILLGLVCIIQEYRPYVVLIFPTLVLLYACYVIGDEITGN